jgi:hypothetical protein
MLTLQRKNNIQIKKLTFIRVIGNGNETGDGDHT